MDGVLSPMTSSLTEKREATVPSDWSATYSSWRKTAYSPSTVIIVANECGTGMEGRHCGRRKSSGNEAVGFRLVSSDA